MRLGIPSVRWESDARLVWNGGRFGGSGGRPVRRRRLRWTGGHAGCGCRTDARTGRSPGAGAVDRSVRGRRGRRRAGHRSDRCERLGADRRTRRSCGRRGDRAPGRRCGRTGRAGWKRQLHRADRHTARRYGARLDRRSTAGRSGGDDPRGARPSKRDRRVDRSRRGRTPGRPCGGVRRGAVRDRPAFGSRAGGYRRPERAVGRSGRIRGRRARAARCEVQRSFGGRGAVVAVG